MLFKHINKNQYKTYLLIGATNVGKSTYFNHLTYHSSPVGNIERITTNPIKGFLKSDYHYCFVDLPGINNLDFSSEDELTSFNYLMNEQYTGVINIISVHTLKRDLLITLDLAEAKVLNLININMIDELKGYEINELKLSSFFKVQVNKMTTRKKIDINHSLIPILTNNLRYPEALNIQYNQKIENLVKTFINLVPNHHLNKKFLIIQALLKNEIVISFFKKNNILEQFNKLLILYDINEQDILSIYETKKNIVEKLIRTVYKQSSNKIQQQKLIKQIKYEKILDSIFLNKYLSIILFILIIALIWFLTFYQYTGGWIQEKLANDGLKKLQHIINEEIINLNFNNDLQVWWANFVSDGLLGGIFTIISFIPWIIILVFSVSLLEQIGILSRVCIAFDQVFAKFGLSGRSIVNIITGIGCNVPSILMAKNTNSKKEKIISIMVMPFISCSARIVVFGFLSQLLVSSQYTWIFNLSMIFLSVLFCLFMAYFFSNILFKKQQSFFIVEINKYHLPSFYIIFKKIINEIFEFLKRVILIVFIANFIIWILTYTGPVKKFYLDINDTSSIKYSFIRYLSIPFQILLYPIGIGQYWQLSISLMTAFPAKEIAASNIDTLFGSIDNFKSLIANIPYHNAIILSYLTFFSFYIPCLSTISIIKKEIGLKYCLLNIFLGLLITWLFSFIVFNISALLEMFNINIINNFNGSITFILLILLNLLIINHQAKQYLNIKYFNKILKIMFWNKIIFYIILILFLITLIINDIVIFVFY